MNIGLRVREVREDLGMSQAELARRVGVARNHIVMIENSSRRPSVALLEKLAHELRTEPAELLREPAPLGEAPVEQGQPEDDDIYAKEGRLWERINLLTSAADQWQWFIDNGLYDLEKVDLKTLQAINAVSTKIILVHALDARAMKRASTDEVRKRLEQSERRLMGTVHEFWSRVERELSRKGVTDLAAVRAQKTQWERASDSRTA